MDAEDSSIDPKLLKIIERNKKPGPFGLKTEIVWGNVIFIFLLHVLAVAGMFVAPFMKWQSWIFFFFYYMISTMGVGAGAHRLWAHRTYKARLPYQIMLMLFNCISMQNDILEWSRDHRVHHKYTETDADPHNALRGFFFAHMGWLMMKKHPEVLRKGRHIDMSDLLNDPVVMFQHNHYYILGLICSVIIPTMLPWLLWNENLLYAFLVCGMFRYVLSLHITWLVNSLAHTWGGRPYDSGINPTENWFLSLYTCGEGFHNYHHSFPYDYSTSEWGPFFNITTIFIDVFAALGLVYDRKQVSSDAIMGIRKRLGNESTSSHCN